MHPTPPIHNAMGEEIASQLMRNQAVGSKESGPVLFTGGAGHNLPGGGLNLMPYAVIGSCILSWMMDVW